MTLVSSIILDAYREANTLPLTALPNDAQNMEALRLYNALLGSLYGTDVGENLSDWPIGDFGRDPSNHFPPISTFRCLSHPPINSRIVATNQGAIVVDLTVRPQDGARYALIDPYGQLATYPVTLNGNGRTIEGVPYITLNTANTRREWVYRGDLGDWTKISNVALTDENPFPHEFDQFFSILLAMRINPRYGRELSDLSTSILRANRAAFVARYITSAPLEINDDVSWPYMSRQGYDTQRSFSARGAFNRGEPFSG